METQCKKRNNDNQGYFYIRNMQINNNRKVEMVELNIATTTTIFYLNGFIQGKV